MPVDPEVQKAFDRRRWLSQMYPLLPKDELLGGFLWAAVYSDGTCFIRHPKGTKIGEYTAEEMSGWYKLSNDGKDAYGPFDTAQDVLDNADRI